jgi:hypothetical protein
MFRHGAGRSADSRYRELRHAWRERALGPIRRPMLGAAGVLLIVGMVRGLDIDWWLGFGFGTLLVTYVALRESMPDHIEQWRRGAEGERRTAKELRQLKKSGWQVIHDLADGKGNRDHVVVGPGGIFLLDTKSLTGRVRIADRDTVCVERIDNPHASYRQKDMADRVRLAAIRLKKDIERSTDQRGLWVNAVIVLWSPFEQRVVKGNHIDFVHGDELVKWLESRPVVQGEAKTAAIAAALSVADRAGA